MDTSVRFDSTRLLFAIFVLNTGTRLDLELIIGPLFGLLFDPKYWPNSGSFSNSEVGSSYLPKFATLRLTGFWVK